MTEDASMVFALLVVADTLRESPDDGSCGPWNDERLENERVVEVEGPDSLILLCGQRLIDAGLPFTVEDAV